MDHIQVNANTFYEAMIKLKGLKQNISTLVICLSSEFDAPLMFSACPAKPELYQQLNYLASEIISNKCLTDLKKFELKCKFTLNGWDCFNPLVEALNQKKYLQSCKFYTTKQITLDSFIYKIKSSSGYQASWN